MNCAKCQHPLEYHLAAADLAPADTEAEKLQRLGLTCVECATCYDERPTLRCSACGKAEPRFFWLRVEPHVFRRFVPVSECCEARIVDRKGHEQTDDDLGLDL